MATIPRWATAAMNAVVRTVHRAWCGITGACDPEPDPDEHGPSPEWLWLREQQELAEHSTRKIEQNLVERHLLWGDRDAPS